MSEDQGIPLTRGSAGQGSQTDHPLPILSQMGPGARRGLRVFPCSPCPSPEPATVLHGGDTCSIGLTGSLSTWQMWPSWAPGLASSEAPCSWAPRRSLTSEFLLGVQERDPCRVLLWHVGRQGCGLLKCREGGRVGVYRVRGS